MSAFLPACVGVVTIETAVTVGEAASSPLEGAAASLELPSVALCCNAAGVTTEVALAGWLAFLSAD